MSLSAELPAVARRLLLAAALALTTACAPAADPERDLALLPGRDAPSRIQIAPPGEPGTPLVVKGRVYAPDGETPVAGVVLYVYHTAADGRYARAGRLVPHLRGWVRTDSEGRYEYRTIRPAPDLDGSRPTHVHALLWGAGYPPQWSSALVFADDPLLDVRPVEKSLTGRRFDPVCAPVHTKEGEQHCTRNYRLKPTGDPFPPELRHAFEPAAIE